MKDEQKSNIANGIIVLILIAATLVLGYMKNIAVVLPVVILVWGFTKKR